MHFVIGLRNVIKSSDGHAIIVALHPRTLLNLCSTAWLVEEVHTPATLCNLILSYVSLEWKPATIESTVMHYSPMLIINCYSYVELWHSNLIYSYVESS